MQIVLTAEAHGGKFPSQAISVNYHHASAVVPLYFKTSWAADQVHVACVIDLKAILFKTGLGVS